MAIIPDRIQRSRPPPRPVAGSAAPRSRSRFGPKFRKIAGGGVFITLVILFWLFVYQNLPGDINGMQYKPINTAGPIDRLVKILAILVGGGIIAAKWSLVRPLAKQTNPGLVLFVALTVVSAAWSIEPTTTLLRFFTLAGIVFTCFGISMLGWDASRFRQVAIPPLMAVLVVSIILGILYPDLIVQEGEDISQKNAWHGITYNKNQFGMTGSLVAIICFHRWLTDKKGAAWSILGTLVALLSVALSRSSTSLLSAVTCISVMVALLRVPIVRQRYSTQVVIGVVAIVLMYETVILNLLPGVNTLLAPVMSLTGKDMTFSNRSIIWEIVKEHSRAAPLLGSGYGAYWPQDPTPGTPSYIFMYVMYFYPTESHNGYLEIMNDLGWVGIGALGLFVGAYIHQALQLMKFDRAQATLYLAVLFQQMIANLSESEWFSRSTVCIVLTLATTCLSRDLLEYRLHHRPQDPQPPAQRPPAGRR